MKKLLTLSLIGTSLIIGSNPAKANEYQFIKASLPEVNGKYHTIRMTGIDSSGSETILKNQSLTPISESNTFVVDLKNSVVDEYNGKMYFEVKENKSVGSNIYTYSYDFVSHDITKLDNDGFTNSGGETDKKLYPKNISKLIKSNSDGTIQIGTDENDIDITSEGLAIDGEPLITKKANGELHIGKNSWITKEENGRQKVYAKDANGNPIPIDYTNGTKLLINGRDIEQSINNVGALSAALTGLPTVPTDTTLACGLGTGTHGGDFAFSGGCASKVNEKLSINYAASMTMPGQDYAGDFEDTFSARAGFIWKLGKATKPTQISMKDKKVMETKIESLEKKNKTILSKNQKLENKLSILMARLEKIEKIAVSESKTKDLAVYKFQ